MNEISLLPQQAHHRAPEVVVVLSGPGDVLSAGNLRERLGQAMGAPGTVVVLDASAVTSLGGPHLRELLAAHTRLAASGRTLLVRTAPSPVATFLEHAGLTLSVSPSRAA